MIVDEFAEVSDSLKQLAVAFITAIRDAAIQKNRPIFSYEMIGMESVSGENRYSVKSSSLFRFRKK